MIEVVKNWSEPKFIRDIQVFLDFANFYIGFIKSFGKIAELLILILKITNTTSLSTILHSLIDVLDKDKDGESDNNETNLSNSSASKRFIGAGYLTSKGTQKSGKNTKNGVKAVKSSSYFISDTKKTFNHLWYTFTQEPILQHFGLEWHIWIETNISGYVISKVLS